MTSAHTLFILNQGRSLKRLAAKGKLSATALAAAGGAIMAASTAQAQSKSKIADDAAVVSMDASSGASVVVGQGLVGATHTHASGLQHNHGPLSWLPHGIQHTHPFDAGSMAGVMGMAQSGGGAVSTAYNGAMMSAPSAYYGAPMMSGGTLAGGTAMGNGLSGGLLLTLGLAGLTGLAALALFEQTDGDGRLHYSGPDPMPYVDPDGDLIPYPTDLSIISNSTLLADEGERGTLDYVTAYNAHGYDLTFAIIGGDVEERFSIDAETGALSFVGARAPEEGDANESVPDFSALSGDADGTDPENGNNTLEVVVQVSDGYGGRDSQEITYYIQNDSRDDSVDAYREADDIARLSDDETNDLTDMTDAEYGRDANGDDLIISVDGSDDVTVTELEGDGDINVRTFGTSGADYYDVAVGDIDGDGDLDVVLAGRDNDENIVEVWESNGSGSFSRELVLDDGSGSSDLDASGTISDVVLGEFNGSGDLDIFVSNDGGDDSLITLSGNYSATVTTFAGLDAAAEAVVISENYINSSTDYVAALENGNISLIDVEDGEQEDEIAGSYVDLAVYRDMVFAADGTSVDVFEADSNSLEVETTGLITGLDRITELVVGDFDDDDSDMELAILDADTDEVYIYELDQYYDSASLAEVMDVSGSATELLSLPENSEAATDAGGNLADDLLVGGSASTIFYDDTSL